MAIQLTLLKQAKSAKIRDLVSVDLVMTDRWLSVEEITEHLGVSKDTVYAWIAKRDMPAHKVGRLWKFQKTEVDAWIKAGGASDSCARGS